MIEDYTFRFVQSGDGPPVEIRIRRMLKSALRHYGLKASWVPQAATPSVPREYPLASETVGNQQKNNKVLPAQGRESLGGPVE